MNVRPCAFVRQPFAKTCTSSRSDVPDDVSHSVAEMPQERHVLGLVLSVRATFLYALNIHLAQHLSRTPRHGAKKSFMRHRQRICRPRWCTCPLALKHLGPFRCEQNTVTRHIFSCFTALISMSHVTVAQGVLRTSSHVSSACCCCCLDTLRPSTLQCSPSLSSSFSFSWSSSSSSMWVGSMRSPMRTSANEELGNVAENNTLTRL